MTDHKSSTHAAVVGLAWGDEGKGKIVDLLCVDFDVVVRYNGGANAGHTVCVGDETFALHLLPSGVIRDGVMSVIGTGVVVDPIALLKEIDALTARGVPAAQRLLISDRAHLVMPYHKLQDQHLEAGSLDRIGTTSRGIGPCYADKMLRTPALRMVDLHDLPRARQRATQVIAERKRMLSDEAAATLAVDEVHALLGEAAERLLPMVTDTGTYLMDQVDAGKRLFFEGANGMLLDIDQGTYPFVTSSHPGPPGISAGAGVPPQLVRRVIGVTKAYTTRVGEGPFPTELHDETAEQIRKRGNEYGTTTGRPRRCGWLDAVALRHSVRHGGVTEIAMTHLDTLGAVDQPGVCTGYRLGTKVSHSLPASPDQAQRIEPIIEELPGWSGDLRSVRTFDDLPAPARDYIQRVEQFVGAPVTIISVGPERDETILRPSAPRA